MKNFKETSSDLRKVAGKYESYSGIPRSIQHKGVATAIPVRYEMQKGIPLRAKTSFGSQSIAGSYDDHMHSSRSLIRQENSSKRLRDSRRTWKCLTFGNALLFGFILIACGVSVPALLAMYYHLNSFARGPVHVDCALALSAIQYSIQNLVVSVNGYTWLFASDIDVNRTTWQRFTTSQQNFGQPLITWASYAPMVFADSRSAWESSNNITITQSSSDAAVLPDVNTNYTFIRQADKSVYYPILYVQDQWNALVGFDLLSDPLTQLLTFRAVNTGNLALGTKLTLDTGNGDNDAMRFVLPIRNSQNAVQGVIMGFFLFRDLIHNTTSAAKTMNTNIAFELFDVTANNGLLYSNGQQSTPSDENVWLQFTIVDRTWLLHCAEATPNLPEAYIAGLFILLTVIISGFLAKNYLEWKRLLKQLRHEQERHAHENKGGFSKEAAARKLDWIKTNASTILSAMKDPFLIVDREGYVVRSNDEALALTSLSTEDLISGIQISRIFQNLTLQSDKRKGEPTSWTGANRSGRMIDRVSYGDNSAQSKPPLILKSASLAIASPAEEYAIDMETLETKAGEAEKANPKSKGKIDISIDSENSDAKVDSKQYILQIESGMVMGAYLTIGSQELEINRNGKERFVEATISEPIECLEIAARIHHSEEFSVPSMERSRNLNDVNNRTDRVQVIVFRDISAYKAANRESQEGREMAEAANAEKSSFLGFVCHELRNPLHAIVGLSSILLQSLTSLNESAMIPEVIFPGVNLTNPREVQNQNSQLIQQEAMDNLASIADAARLMQGVVNDMRVLSKLENGTVELEARAFELTGLLDSIYRTQMAACNHISANGAMRSNVSIQVTLKGLNYNDSTIPASFRTSLRSDETAREWIPSMLIGDVSKLMQILVAFISNGVEHTKQGTVCLKVTILRCSPQPDDTGSTVPLKVADEDTHFVLLSFEIEDTGKGIPRSRINSLYRPIGLGQSASYDTDLSSLSIMVATTYLRMMNSALKVTSVLDKGTTLNFNLWLPLAPETSKSEITSPPSIFSSLPQADETNPRTTPPNLILGPNDSARRQSISYNLPHQPSLTPKSRNFLDSPPWARERMSSHNSVIRSPNRSPRTVFQSLRTSSANNIPWANTESNPSGAIALDPLEGLMNQDQGLSNLTKGQHTAPIAATSAAAAASVLSSDKGQSSLNPAGQQTFLRSALKKQHPAKSRLGIHPNLARAIRVLVVEDDPILLKIAVKDLTRSGFEVDTATNGLEALNKLKDKGPTFFDVCLMDLLMDVMDGFDACEQIRKEKWTIPVIALTAKSLESDRLRCFRLGFSYFMTKPFQLGDIATIIRYMVGAEAEQDVRLPDGGPMMRYMP